MSDYKDIDKLAEEVVAQSHNLAAFDLCALYTKVKPILAAVQSIIGFFKPTWAQAVGLLIAVLDAQCAPNPVV